MPDIAERLEKVVPTIRAGAELADREATAPRSSIQALADAGLLGVLVPTELGGLGATAVEFADTVATIASACGSTAMIALMHCCATAVIAAAPPTDGDVLLRDLASGRRIGTLAFSEKGSRSHFWAPVSRAARNDGQSVCIAADKSWVTSASLADVYVVSTLAPAAEAPLESNLYVVGRTMPGVDISGGFDGLGLRGNDSAPVRIDVTVSDDARLGNEAGGFGLLMQVVLPWFNLGNAAVSTGLARAALEGAISHAGGTQFEHLGSSLSDLPTIRAYLAKAWADLAAHEALLHDTATRLAEPDDQTMLYVLAAKAACNEAALRITETALRVTGGAGFSKHLAIDRPYRDARAGFVMAPTADALFDFIGRALCGMELFA